MLCLNYKSTPLRPTKLRVDLLLYSANVSWLFFNTLHSARVESVEVRASFSLYSRVKPAVQHVRGIALLFVCLAQGLFSEGGFSIWFYLAAVLISSPV